MFVIKNKKKKVKYCWSIYINSLYTAISMNSARVCNRLNSVLREAAGFVSVSPICKGTWLMSDYYLLFSCYWPFPPPSFRVQMKYLQYMYHSGWAWQYNIPAFNSNVEPFWKDREFLKYTEKSRYLKVHFHWSSELVDRHFMSRCSLGYILH